MDVSWKRVLLALGATMLSLYTVSFAVSAIGGTPSINLMVGFVALSNAVWWGILLYPRAPVRA